LRVTSRTRFTPTSTLIQSCAPAPVPLGGKCGSASGRSRYDDVALAALACVDAEQAREFVAT
jgi:hypothetical protein